jgi:hypothetical protein
VNTRAAGGTIPSSADTGIIAESAACRLDGSYGNPA